MLLAFVWSYRDGKRTVTGCFALILFLAATVSAAADNSNDPLLQPAALKYTGTYDLRQFDPELTGKGVTIAAVCRSLTYVDGQPQDDYQPNMEHKCLWDRQVTFADGIDFQAGISPHSTAISGILVGNDPNAYHPDIGRFHYQGAAPEARIDVYEFWRFVRRYIFTGTEPKADILTMSMGTALEDWWTRGIERLVEKTGMIVIAGIGNGSNVCDPVLYPAAGANAIGVGVIDSVRTEQLLERLSNFSLPQPAHSSSGPTPQARCKPDIVAPGNCLVPDANNSTGYAVTGDWSSFATPVVAGTVGLLLQKAASEPNLSAAVSTQGRNCVIKAILMNSATKLPYWHKGTLSKDDDHHVSLDYIQGAGALNAPGAYQHLIAGQGKVGNVGRIGWDNATIGTNPPAENIYNIEIPHTTGKFITATLAWNRHFSDDYPFDAIPGADADLRLEVWAVDTNNPQNTYLIDYSNSPTDYVEHIYLPLDPNYNSYQIVVTPGDGATGNSDSTTQRYGLAWNVGQADSKDSIWWFDLNGDGKLDDLDFTIMLNRLDKTGEVELGYPSGDINTDGVIDIKDIKLLLAHINSS